LKSLGFPIANDQIYGGNIKNDGTLQLKPEWFENSYQNTEEAGKKEFLILWLHAYRYKYEDVLVKTELPDWVTDD
jgi:23S rRNA-/tRNA-specific pseudouridylate synthase